MLQAAVRAPLRAHLERVRWQHAKDLASGLGRAPLPDALARKYPGADRRWAWQWVFPASPHYVDRDTGSRTRTTRTRPSSRRPSRRPCAGPGWPSPPRATPSGIRSPRTSWSMGTDVRTIQELRGRKDVKTTMIYAHVLNRGGKGVRSPMDGPAS